MSNRDRERREFRAAITVDRISANRQSVVEALKKNRTEHQRLFNEAVNVYRKQATQVLEESLPRLRNQSNDNPQIIQLPDPPENWIRVYDSYIGLFEMSSEPTIMMSVENYSAFIQDNWSWKQRFLDSIEPYSASAKTTAAGR